MCVTGLTIRHVRERFQRSNATILKYFIEILDTVSIGPLYDKYVQLPHTDAPVPDYIHNNTKLWPFFKDALGAMDGTYINCIPPAILRHLVHNQKGSVTQNVLACCDF
ncbi:hypothetical protein FISHEDRAFT_44912 [Fistulina hepatica ATCC 64428]|uniref:DDE Tnp4 domain-containing protein n=1 Tax=Fistulina hepatica ATCC 64428 TaxID=1128425 RepID=A0A0D7AB58_9AGAR|nr:hypothetical protein FISHEDRAFT_44912 [Fistulina hepatica ATCC 64428]